MISGMVYIASPLRGAVSRNRRYAMAALKHSLSLGEAPFVPHLLYPLVLDDDLDTERRQGMEAGLGMLRVAALSPTSKLAVYADLGISSGMAAEIAEAERLGIEVVRRTIGFQEKPKLSAEELHLLIVDAARVVPHMSRWQCASTGRIYLVAGHVFDTTSDSAAVKYVHESTPIGIPPTLFVRPLIEFLAKFIQVSL